MMTGSVLFVGSCVGVGAGGGGGGGYQSLAPIL